MRPDYKDEFSGFDLKHRAFLAKLDGDWMWYSDLMSTHMFRLYDDAVMDGMINTREAKKCLEAADQWAWAHCYFVEYWRCSQ